MPLSLDELMQSPHAGLPEMAIPVCVAGKLNAEFDVIDAELDRLLNEPYTPVDPEGETGRVPRHGEKTARPRNPRIKELNDRREELRKVMADHMVTVLLRAREDGLWRDWKSKNPPRDDEDADLRAGLNIDALIAAIGRNPRDWVAKLNGEGYTDEQWAFVWKNAGEGNQWRLAAGARQLHTSGVDVPKSLSASLERLTSDTSSS